MKTRILLLFGVCAIISIMTACNQNGSKNDVATIDSVSNKKLNTVFHNYWETHAKLFPVEATLHGDNRYNDRIQNTQTQAFRNLLKGFYQSYLDTVEVFNHSKLTAENKINYDIFIYQMKMELKGLSLNNWMIPFSQIGSPPMIAAMMGSGTSFQPFKTVNDYNNWLKRINGFTVRMDSAIGNFRKGMHAGVVLPKILVKRMIPQMNSMIVKDPVKSLFYKPVMHFPDSFSKADKQRLTKAYKKAILTEIVPIYKKLGNFFQQEYLSKASDASGLYALPDGKEMYRYWVKYSTTTDETPEHIYQTGLSEVKRITHIMDSIKNTIGFKGDLKSLLHYMKTDKKFKPYKTPEEVLNGYRSIYKRIKPNLKKMFHHFPKTPFEIRQTEAFREKAMAVPQYLTGSPDGTRPGIFYVPVPDASKYATPIMESVFLHEGIPGHHFQISIQQEDTSLPDFRRYTGNSAYIEGWALYCESLGKELGLYTDPYQYLGALSGEMLRAVRLVVDVSLHTGKMDHDEAVQYMLAHLVMPKPTVVSEVERYMAAPGQALSYKIGELKIRSLRNKYKKELGNKFDLAAFHDELLSGGSMPLKILEEKMDAWAKNQK